MNKLLKSLALAFAGALTLSSAALADAGAAPDLRVAHGDLDLSRPDGAAVFKARVNTAVNEWCEQNEHLFSGQPLSASNSCHRHAHAQVRFAVPEAEKQALRIAAAATREPAIEIAAR